VLASAAVASFCQNARPSRTGQRRPDWAAAGDCQSTHGNTEVFACWLRFAKTSAYPHRLELEITESLLLEDTGAVLTELGKLKALGVAIVMDDFGTGYSSLSYLWRFPFDKIKIDRVFMRGFDSDAKNVATIVRTIVALGRSLNMRVTAEGVENARQAQFVRDVDCDQIQGFYFGRPMPAGELAAHILADFQGAFKAGVVPCAAKAELRTVN
jgi:EAL domain-containing protein (putative c-di-GMP-specific phosphodiesterase class I)